ncbi:hypothetical protein G6K93_07455 [Agrobacterium rhizogenes]|nr:hypothetical protein [Rhizobium rhizogenes]
MIYAKKPTGPKFEDLTGQRFGIATVTGYLGKQGIKSLWEYRCDCGFVGSTASANMKIKKSCGCLHRASLSARQRTHGETVKNRRSTEYVIWADMIDRCENPKCEHFKDYGARGIRICRRWKTSVANFIEDMGRRPSRNHSIDRINNNGNYEPGNCRWATWKQQQRNRTGLHLIRWDDETITLQEACDRVSLKDVTVHGRLRRGWSLQDALRKPPIRSGKNSDLTDAIIADIGKTSRINQGLALAGRLRERAE